MHFTECPNFKNNSKPIYECLLTLINAYTVKLGNKERIDKEQIGIKEPFPVTNLPFTS